MVQLPKRYDFRQYEEKIYRRWEENGYFTAPTNQNPKTDPHYCIVIPPPNITGELHMGHALNNTIQDILIRYHRMLGKATLWLPGTDHASIATENVVERELLKRGIKKRSLGRERFLRYVWEWKEKYGGIIVRQLRRLGVSCDWSRERFTMDEHLSKAVREAFVRLYNDGLIYRGEYLVNWCPRCRTALSDDEVERRTEEGKLWFLRYPFKEGEEFVEVATTRPETMLGDTAVAVHPKDDRYRHLIGKKIVLPLLGREIPVVADEVVDPDFGTGSVKVTPAHDPTDFEIAKRHKLPFINILNEDGTLNKNAGPYAGLDRYDARQKVLQDLQKKGLLSRVEDYELTLGRCYRCGTVIEPFLSEQWFVRMKPLAEKAIRVVEEKKMRFFPKRWTEFYLQWLREVRDWCISRQLWWGHRIPVFYCDDCGNIFADSETPENCPKCSSTKIRQDEDVLDTWFSSALWPFSTMGWPDFKIKDGVKLFERYFPTNVLVTAREIIFFWVARMAMTSLQFLNKIPFYDVYIHGTILDELGRKMSKSLGNGIDPLEMVEIYGADAVRFSLIMLTVEGQDLKLSPTKFEMGRNFCNKLWNAMRFAIKNIKKLPDLNFRYEELALEDRWILSRLQDVIKVYHNRLQRYLLNPALKTLYDFIWHEFCDWYLELIKPRLSAEGQDSVTAQKVLFVVSDSVLRLLHPFCPFITEHLWDRLFSAAGQEKPKIEGLKDYADKEPMLMIAPMPQVREDLINKEAEEDIALLTELVRGVRNVKAGFGLHAKTKVSVTITSTNRETLLKVLKNRNFLLLMGQMEISAADVELPRPPNSATSICGDVTVFVHLGGLVDIGKERERLKERIKETENRVARLKELLSNEQFLEKAPKEVVEKQRAAVKDAEKLLQKLRENLIKLNESSSPTEGS